MNDYLDVARVNDCMLNVMSSMISWRLSEWDVQIKRFDVYSDEFWRDLTEHTHPFFELAIMLKGGINYTIENRKIRIDSKSPVILLTPPQLLHNRAAIKKDDTLVIIQFSLTPRNQNGTADMEKLLTEISAHHYQLNISKYSNLRRIIDLCLNTPPLWKERIECELQLYLMNIFSECMIPILQKKRQLSNLQLGGNWLERIERLIDVTLDSKISLNEYSAKLGLSARQIERIIKQRHKMSFSHYLRKKRMDVAKNLLSSPFNSIKSIANSLGYDDVSHFCRLFRESTGMTPGAFAKLAKKDQ